jgi:hypothetical protein
VGALSVSGLGIERAAVLFNTEVFIISQQRAEEVAAQDKPEEAVIRDIITKLRVLWSTATVLLAGILLLPVVLIRRQPLISLFVLVGGLIAVGVSIAINLGDMNYHLPINLPLVKISSALLLFGMPILALVISVRNLYENPKGSHNEIHDRRWLFWVVPWLLLWVILYSVWGDFRDTYLAEFLAPLALLSGWAIAQFIGDLKSIRPLWFGRGLAFVIAVLFVASWYQGLMIASRYPFTGTMSLKSLSGIVALVEQRVPANQPLFTAQSAVPALSGRPQFLGYSHPGWILYEQLGTVSIELRELYFLGPSAVTDYLRTEVNYVLTDRRTVDVFFNPPAERQDLLEQYSDRQDLLEQHFELIGEIPNENSQTPFRLYERK